MVSIVVKLLAEIDNRYCFVRWNKADNNFIKVIACGKKSLKP